MASSVIKNNNGVVTENCPLGSNSIVDRGSVKVRKNGRVVTVWGSINLTASATSADTAFTVPASYIDPHSTMYGTLTDQSSNTYIFQIPGNGIVTCTGMTAGQWNSLVATYII